MSVRLLGIQIANGFSSEAQVFASLLALTDPAPLDAQVLCQGRPEDMAGAAQFRDATGATVQPLDFGWRSMSRGRSLGAKVQSRLRFLAALPRALRLARRGEPDLIYSSQQLWDCQAATYIARRLGKPQVVHLHYTVGPWLHPPVLARLRTCDHVVAISEFIREEALRNGTPEERVTTVYNAVAVPAGPEPGIRAAVRQELGLDLDAPVLGIVARLDPEKGQADTLAAFALAAKRHPAARLLIVGEPTPWHPGYDETLKQQAAELGLGDRVLFLGRRSDVPRLLAATDIFVHPSRREPFGLAVAEASAAGLPVVAYAEGGTGELVADGETGLLASAGDVDGLAHHLETLLNNPAQAQSLGRQGRQRMEARFRPDEAACAFTDLLCRVSKL